jgi:hypothetical protein
VSGGLVQAPAKLTAYLAVLTVVLLAALGVGALVGPWEVGGSVEDGHGMTGTAAMQQDVVTPAGLSASQSGYTFAIDDAAFTPGVARPFSFRILGPGGTAVTSYDTRHERDLHLIVTSDDLADYQHVHPQLDSDGTWTTTLALPRAGGYRAYADFAPAGAKPLTLGVALTAAGFLAPQRLPAPTSIATVAGYEVRLQGAMSAGSETEVVFQVQRDGAPVNGLEPYLGAYGHLVAVRAADLAYLHVHPTPASSTQAVAFAVEALSPGAYRLFLDFQHGGVVRTAAFTVDVPAGTGGTTTPDGEGGHGGH